MSARIYDLLMDSGGRTGGWKGERAHFKEAEAFVVVVVTYARLPLPSCASDSWFTGLHAVGQTVILTFVICL